MEVSEDLLTVEEPLAIDVSLLGSQPPIYNKTVSITMRTPGRDEDLAVGFLYTEGLIKSAADIKQIVSAPNAVEVFIHQEANFDINSLQRNFYSTSSCGICGKASIDSIRTAVADIGEVPHIQVSTETIYSLPDKLRAGQSLFTQTGGIHAVGLFSPDGELLTLCEDVGRHNALDKLIGSALRGGKVPLSDHVLLLSGRASFELVQKAAMAHIQVIAAVGAPSSLAVQVAEEFGITLLGFVNHRRYNVYCGEERII